MTEPQVPRMPDVMTPAFDALASGLDDRALAARNWQANHGRWGDVLRGWNGQAQLLRARLTKEIKATRNADFNTGQPLRELVASEYARDGRSLDESPQFAIGEMELVRTKVSGSSSATGTFMAGTIFAGTRFARPLYQSSDWSLPDADYTSTEELHCGSDDTSAPVNQGGGQWLHTQQFTVPIIAARPGSDGNTPTIVPGALADRLFDFGQPVAERFRAGSVYSAGGSVQIDDAQVRAFGKAMGRGSDGANNAAAIAGCLADPRVRRVAFALDYATAILWLYVADSSWATSVKYRAVIKQSLFDNNWIGFGSRIQLGRILNSPITVRATVVLRSQAFQADSSVITTAVVAALRRYFDERPDFYTWRLSAIGGVIAKADPRILTCTSPAVLSEGSVQSDPVATIAGGALLVPHYHLSGVTLTFASPGA